MHRSFSAAVSAGWAAVRKYVDDDEVLHPHVPTGRLQEVVRRRTMLSLCSGRVPAIRCYAWATGVSADRIRVLRQAKKQGEDTLTLRSAQSQEL